MTSNITPITATSNDGDNGKREDDKAPPEHGLAVLRDREGRGLISLACDALYEASNLAQEMHTQLYTTSPAEGRDLQRMHSEAVTCLETAEHYLLMLGSVLEERATPQDPAPDAGPWPVEPAF
jgi:hypothetical protein